MRALEGKLHLLDQIVHRNKTPGKRSMHFHRKNKLCVNYNLVFFVSAPFWGVGSAPVLCCSIDLRDTKDQRYGSGLNDSYCASGRERGATKGRGWNSNPDMAPPYRHKKRCRSEKHVVVSVSMTKM